MKRIFLLVILITLLVSACAPSHVKIATKTPPPGQMKKISGEKSAKQYAPGQQKKKIK